MSTPDERRSRILDAASRLLCHYGPQKTTVADVAREAGVGVGTVYLEFPSKDAIVDALSRARHAEVLTAMRVAATKGSAIAESLAGALTARLEALIRVASEGAHARDLVHCPVTPAVLEAQRAYQRDELVLISDMLRRGALVGELDVADHEAAAKTVLRAYVTFTLPWLAERDPEEARASIAAMHVLVLRGLLRRGAKTARPSTKG